MRVNRRNQSIRIQTKGKSTNNGLEVETNQSPVHFSSVGAPSKTQIYTILYYRLSKALPMQHIQQSRSKHNHLPFLWMKGRDLHEISRQSKVKNFMIAINSNFPILNVILCGRLMRFRSNVYLCDSVCIAWLKFQLEKFYLLRSSEQNFTLALFYFFLEGKSFPRNHFLQTNRT